MITPYFEQATYHLSEPDVFGKWFCTNGEWNLTCRYMSPIGWKETAHWYNSKEEAEADFNKFERQDLAGLAATDEFAAIERRMKMVEKVMELSIEVNKLRAENEELKAEIVKWKDYVRRTKTFGL